MPVPMSSLLLVSTVICTVAGETAAAIAAMLLVPLESEVTTAEVL